MDRLIVFDLGNTIIRFDHRISARKVSRRFGIDEDRLYQTLFDSEITRAFDTGKLTPRGFHDELTRLLKIEIPYEEFVPIWSEIFWEDEDACRLVRRLKGRWPLCLMSNVNELHFEYIKGKFPVIAVFDHIVLSYVVGAMKPDRRIYEHAARLAGVDFSQMIYIDDREDLVTGARAYGIDSFRFETARGLEDWLTAKKVL